jgi:hypothetical protein
MKATSLWFGGREVCNGAGEKLEREAKDETARIFGGKEVAV